MITIVLSHPWHGSFNKAILDTITTKLDKENKAYQIIDLHKDKFEPAYTEDDLSVYNKGQYKDPLVGKYQAMLKNTSEIILVFPIWWGNMPAMLKGFFDKTFLYDFAFNYENGWNGLLTNIKKASLITTSEQVSSAYNEVMEYNKNSILKAVGIADVVWYNCEKVSRGTDEDRKNFLEKVSASI